MRTFLLLAAICVLPALNSAQQSPAKILALYSTNVESDHVEFAEQAIPFLNGVAQQHQFQLEAVKNWNILADPDRLASYRLVIWLDDFPHSDAQRRGFQRYMENGGGWLGFHIAAYNDKNTQWPWFVDFLGGAIFYSNNWPPLPAELVVDDRSHPATRRLPATFTAPANEWYVWSPSPRLNKNVRVLLTLDPSNYPLGFKDTLRSGDLPVVWTNTKFRMLYMNMGHGNKIFSDQHQNNLIEDALLWLLR